jgi:hypothetical protein
MSSDGGGGADGPKGPADSMTTLHEHFDQFLRERVYLLNITTKTKQFYETAWMAYCRA